LDEAPARPAAPTGRAINLALSGSKLVYSGAWQDVSDQADLMRVVHPVIGENISLKRRAELLVRLVAQSEFESQQIDHEIKECDDVIRDLHKMLGDDLPEPPEEEPPDEDSTTPSDM
jgi:hypothetical protein